MMKLIMEFYEKSLTVLTEETDVDKVVSLPVRENIGRFKYIPEDQIDERYNEIKDAIKRELKELSERGE